MEQNLEHFPPPPPWRRQKLGDKITYINDISGEETETHPLTSYFTQAAALQDEDSLSNHMTHLPEEDISVSTEDQMMIFRCEWKEVGLLGHVLSYGMNLCYYRNDHHFEITFDGVRACWRFSRLDGPYGPLDEDDLFIGSKITVFDRHLTISSANSHICQMIDHKGQLLRKRISWLQSKLESIGICDDVLSLPIL